MTSLDIKNYRLRELDEVMSMSDLLAESFPNPEQYKIGIYELLINAIEHGNLEIGYEAKTALLQQGKWEAEIARRLALPEYCAREVSIKLMRDNNVCCVTIADQGRGFQWKKHMSSLASGRRPNGRGLMIAMNCNFDKISFNPSGNEVTCIAKFHA